MIYAKRAILQLKNNFPLFIISNLLVLGLLLIVALISFKFNIKIQKFTGDPVVILNGHPFTGALSNLGILFWCSTAAVCFFSALIHKKNNDINFSRFMFFSGLITLILLIDDLFLFHEIILPDFIGIPQNLVYIGYFSMIISYFIIFRNMLLTTDYAFILIACGFFALSVVIDVILPSKGIQHLFEDGFKLLGIVTWFIFFVKTSYNQVFALFINKDNKEYLFHNERDNNSPQLSPALMKKSG